MMRPGEGYRSRMPPCAQQEARPSIADSSGVSGFISGNNADPIARNTNKFMHGIPREETVTWNLICRAGTEPT
jgi:hypothetical protein